MNVAWDSVSFLKERVTRLGTVGRAVLAVAALLASLTYTLSANAQPAGLVAVYSFAEGAGTTVADASGNNNTRTISGATWTTAGKLRGARDGDRPG
jgi:predicted homoserine dehydrogenase-like protein